MTLPLKSTLGVAPLPSKLNPGAHAAILDDASIELGIRIAVLVDLEIALEPGLAFETICKEEELRGSPAPTLDLVVGRAMTLASFERGLASGWFGADPMGAAIARSLVDDLKTIILTGDSSGAISTLRSLLDPGTGSYLMTRRVTWYYYDESNPTNPLNHVASNLAHRLALPCMFGKVIDESNPLEFIVFALPAEFLNAPKKPRFTDCGDLRFLDVWRPGGKTAPWISGYLGLDEAVDLPTILGRTVTDIKIILCY